PGWHIECSAMSMKYLGNDIDIHTGGEDNIFPHHESEIAQSEAAHGKKFVHYWFHVRHLLVNNQKMSKSLGNFYTVRDIVARGYHPLVLRYALSNTHYRQPLNFTLESLKSASHALQRLRDFKQMLSEKKKERVESSQKKIGCLIEKSVLKLIDTTKQNFETALDDDLNISEALAAIFDLVREINKLDLNPGEAEATYQLINKLDSIIGVLGVSETGEVSETENIPENVLYVLKSGDLSKEVENLIGERNQARQDRDYQRADQIRQQLKEIGVVLEDTPQGVRWKKIL
ncbi:MAG: DALR domain-containing protein, partial [Planctomycetota bacterium]